MLLHVAISNVSSEFIPIYHGLKNSYNGDLYLANVNSENGNGRNMLCDFFLSYTKITFNF